MKNETKGFILLTLSIICFCTHQICDRLFWITAAMSPVQPSTGNIIYGGIALFVIAILLLVSAIFFFLRAIRNRH